tara:strand:+ start:213 stop:725 length:513 start_codon:yes stop_codon:yes gene_type:complete
MQTSTEMRVWIGCLACYNNGNLRGDWHNANCAGDVTPEDVHGGPSSHDELWCMDTEGFPSGTGEMSPQEAQDMADAFEAVDEPAAFAAWIAAGCGTLADADEFRAAYCGEFESEEDYAQELADEIGAIPPGVGWPCTCIDWGRAARELFCGDYWSTSVRGGRTVYVFRSQ